MKKCYLFSDICEPKARLTVACVNLTLWDVSSPAPQKPFFAVGRLGREETKKARGGGWEGEKEEAEKRLPFTSSRRPLLAYYF